MLYENAMKTLSKNEVGRPTLLVPETVTKLESILKIGGTIEEACSYALISRETYYRWLKENEDFMTKMESAQHYSDIVAKNIVVDSMHKDKNLDTAKWWLEKRVFKQNGPMVQVNNQVNSIEFYTDENKTAPDTADRGTGPAPVQDSVRREEMGQVGTLGADNAEVGT